MKSNAFRSIVKVTPTRYVGNGVALYIGGSGKHWRVVAEQDGDMNETGAICKSKMEAFSILSDVARNWGFTA